MVSGGHSTPGRRWRADFRAVATVLTPTSPVQTVASFEVLEGAPGAVPA